MGLDPKLLQAPPEPKSRITQADIKRWHEATMQAAMQAAHSMSYADPAPVAATKNDPMPWWVQLGTPTSQRHPKKGR